MADENNKKEPSVDGEATKGFPILLLPGKLWTILPPPVSPPN